MLDYQINEAIARAYLESVCGCSRRRKVNSRRRRGRRLNEEVNDVSTVSMPMDSLSQDVKDRAELDHDIANSPDGYKRALNAYNNIKAEQQRQQGMDDIHSNTEALLDAPLATARDRDKTYMSMANYPAPETPKIGRDMTRVPPYMSDNSNVQDKAPAMRIGKNVYKGAALMLPYSLAGRTAEEMNLLDKIAKLQKENEMLKKAQTVQKAGGTLGKKILKAATIGLPAGYGLEQATEYFDDKADNNNLRYIRPAVDGLSEFGQWAVGLPYKAYQTAKDIYDETIDEIKRFDCDKEITLDNGKKAKCNFRGKNDDDLRRHLMIDHGQVPKKQHPSQD